MRLLELENEKNATSQQAAIMPRKTKKTPAATEPQRPPSNLSPRPSGTPATGRHILHKPIRRRPIDLEQLQERVEVLERRIRERARTQGAPAHVQELGQLKQRLKLLERSVHTELWAAKQREHTLLEMLARPPLKQLVRAHARKFRHHTLPAAWTGLRAGTREWWRLYQPVWWPAFARAWQESLDKARGIDSR